MRTIKRRRREGKTDYKARLALLKSRKPRIVVRKTNRYLISQCVESKESRDRVIVGLTSKELIKYGWENIGSLKSLPACYLTGILLGKRIKRKVKGEVILDTGLIRNVRKSRIYALLKGLVDSGVNVKSKEDIFPDEKRIKGEHLKNKIDFEKIKDKILKENK